jgi:hypothetical protein
MVGSRKALVCDASTRVLAIRLSEVWNWSVVTNMSAAYDKPTVNRERFFEVVHKVGAIIFRF